MPAGGEQYGAWFDHAAADAACDFFPRYLRHTEAEWAGQPFELADWQAERIIRPLFGWKRADGTRLIRTVYLEVPRKNGKTELAAGVSIIALVGDGEFGGQVYALAIDKGQANILFDKASLMVGNSEELSQILEVWKTSIYHPGLVASFKPFSSAPKTKHGFSPTGSFCDEIHEWPDSSLYQVVHDGMAARSQPIEFLTTTAGIVYQGFGWEMHEYAKKVSDGILEDPTFLAVIFAAGEDDDALPRPNKKGSVSAREWRRVERIWAKANPGLGVSPKLDFIRDQARRAREIPRLENNFKRFHLIQWTEQSIRWIPMERWDACKGGFVAALEEGLRGRKCWGGLDLASTADINALLLAFPLNENFMALLARFWVPEEQAKLRRSASATAQYDDWINAGLIKATPGNVTDYDVIRKDIVALGEIYNIREIAFDRWNATQLTAQLAGDGFTMVEFGQGFASMSGPSKDLERLFLDKRLMHGGHAVLRWMAANVAVRTDPAGNIKPDRDKSSEKIDGIVAAVMGVGRAVAGMGGEDSTTYLQSNELLVL